LIESNQFENFMSIVPVRLRQFGEKLIAGSLTFNCASGKTLNDFALKEENEQNEGKCSHDRGGGDRAIGRFKLGCAAQLGRGHGNGF
jgi:hypothetical protein